MDVQQEVREFIPETDWDPNDNSWDPNDNRFLSDEIAAVTAAANALLDKDEDEAEELEADMEDYFDECPNNVHTDPMGCDCCPLGKHESIFSKDCNCFVEINAKRLLLPKDTNMLMEWEKDLNEQDKGNKKNLTPVNSPTQSVSQYYTPPTTFEPHCKHPATKVIVGDKNEWSIWAGRKFDIEDYVDDFDLVINLTGNSVLQSHNIPIPELQKWESGGPQCTEILLDWPDYGIVKFPVQFWIELMEYIADKKLAVTVFCVGGHGRTGTVIACMLVVGLKYSAKGAISWVRTNYCKKAIESKKQEDYIAFLEQECIKLEKEEKK